MKQRKRKIYSIRFFLRIVLLTIFVVSSGDYFYLQASLVTPGAGTVHLQIPGLTADGFLYQIRGAQRTEVPFELIDNRPVISVRLNSTDRIFRFVLDTGAGSTVVSTRTANQLNLKRVRTGIRAAGVGGKFHTVFGLLWSCEIGKVRLDNVPVIILPSHERDKSIDGWLGVTFISRFVTTVDYGQRVMTFERPRKPRSSSSRELNLPIKSSPTGILCGGARIDGIDEPVSFIVDTAASVSVLHRDARLLPSIDLYKKGDMVDVLGSAGVEQNVTVLFLPSLKLGSAELQNFKVALLDLKHISKAAGSPQMGILGGNFLRNYRVVIDLPNRSLRLSPL